MEDGRAAAAALELAASGLARSKSVGALLVPPQQVGVLKAALQRCGCLLPGRSICCWDQEPGAPADPNPATLGTGRRVAMHVTAEMAAVLNNPSCEAAQVPHELAHALRSGQVVWQPGVRLGSTACGGPRGKQCDSAVYVLREAVFSRPIWRPAIPPQRFCFAELFAGIGGFRLVRHKLLYAAPYIVCSHRVVRTLRVESTFVLKVACCFRGWRH